MIKKAAAFAERMHEGKVRKGSDIPYITHPMEAAVIVSGMTGDPEIISAALLHDVIEDAGVTYQELEERFGKRIADLVLAESEDKSKTWKERKSATIERLKKAGRAEKMICLGDKLSNLRSTAADRLRRGDGVWAKFRVKDKKEHEWYYRGVFEQLGELKGELAYKESVRLMKEIFDSEDTDTNDC